MKTARSRLREELTARYVPLLLEAGFHGPKKINGNQLFHDYRRRSPHGTQVLSIQFDKRQRPRFVLQLHVEPEEGMDALIARGRDRHRPPPAATRSSYPLMVPRRPAVVATAPPLHGGKRGEKAVDECIRLLPEAEAWWTHQAPSQHIRCLTIRYSGHSRAASGA